MKHWFEWLVLAMILAWIVWLSVSRYYDLHWAWNISAALVSTVTMLIAERLYLRQD